MEGMNSELLSRLLSASALRARVIAGNIANQSTPGFTRQVVQFEDLLSKKLSEGSGSDALAGIEPVIVDDHSTPPAMNGNNVQLELELNAMRENRILYETYASILAGKADLLKSSIESVS